MVSKAQVTQRQAAGKASAKSRQHLKTAGIDGEQLQERITAQMAKYSKVPAPKTWADVEKKEKARGQVILNEQRQLDVEIAAGKLVTPEQHEEEKRRIAQLCAESVDRISEMLVEECDSTMRNEMRKMGKRISNRINNLIYKALKS